eukprot:m.225582 g.225582  ORF g.225582 m.225582 type:complete len:1526 (+) comp33464_c0_seq2:186-4763(+)
MEDFNEIHPDMWSKLMNSAALTSFLPKKLRASLSGSYFSRSQVRAEYFKGAVLFVDISGFTVLNEKLKKENPETAADRMCGILNNFFQPVIDTIYKNGGDVFKFSGDAVTVVFLVDGKDFPDLQSVARQATYCSEAIHDCAIASQHGLSLHMAIGVGSLTGVQVGGKNNRMEYILAGKPMDQISIGENLAAKLETCISPQTWEYLKDDDCITTLVNELDDEYYANSPVKSKPSSATYEVDAALERSERKATHREPVNAGYRMLQRDQFREWRFEQGERPEPNADGLFEILGTQRHNDHSVEAVSELIPIVDAMKSFIPGAVVSRLADGQDGLDLADTLKLSCIFVSIEGLDLAASDDTKDELQRVQSLAQRLMLKIQESVYSCEGSINKILVDDKGLLCVCALGLPPTYHGDDPMRAVKCAGYLLKNIKSLAEQPKVKIGVTTGTNVFCGVVGSQVRREYTVMGPVVNLSARLMSNSAWGSMMVCETTERATSSEFMFKPPIIKLLKGIGPTPLYEPVFDDDGRIKLPEKKKSKNAKFGYDKILASIKHGRDDKLSELHTMLRKCKEKKSGVILLMGDRGSGKGFVADKLPIIAQAYGYIPLNSKGKSKTARPDAMSYEEYQKFKKLYEPMRYDEQLLKQTGDGDLFQPLNGWTMFSAWHEILETCVTTGAKKKGISKAQWIDETLANHEDGSGNFPLYGEAHNLRDILPEGYVSQSGARRTSGFSDEHFGMAEQENMDFYGSMGEHAYDGGDQDYPMMASKPVQPVTKVDKVRDILIAVLIAFAREMGKPVLVIIQLKRATDIFTGIDENWDLVCKIGKLTKSVIMCAVTRNLQKFDATAQITDQNKERMVTDLIKKATKDDTKIDLDAFDDERRIKFVADVLSHPDMQLDNKEETFIIHPLDIKKLPKLAQRLSDVAAGNPKYIIEFLGAMLTGFSGPHKYHTADDNAIKELHEADWAKPAIAITGNSCIEVLCRDISFYPTPTKIVGYVWQQYETLTVHQQYLLKAASSFEYGFTMDMLNGMVKEKSDYRKDEGGMVRLSKDVFGLKQEQILDIIDEQEIHSEVDVDSAYAKDSGLVLLNILKNDGQPAYKFRTKLLQRLITERFTTKDKAEMQLRKKMAFAKCRWRRVRAFIRKLMQSKKDFEKMGFTILDKNEFSTMMDEFMARNEYLQLLVDETQDGTLHPDVDKVRKQRHSFAHFDVNESSTDTNAEYGKSAQQYTGGYADDLKATLEERDRLISRLQFDRLTQLAMVLTNKVKISRLQCEKMRLEELYSTTDKRLQWYVEQHTTTDGDGPDSVSKILAEQDQTIRNLQNKLRQAEDEARHYVHLAEIAEQRVIDSNRELELRPSFDDTRLRAQEVSSPYTAPVLKEVEHFEAEDASTRTSTQEIHTGADTQTQTVPTTTATATTTVTNSTTTANANTNKDVDADVNAEGAVDAYMDVDTDDIHADAEVDVDVDVDTEVAADVDANDTNADAEVDADADADEDADADANTNPWMVSTMVLAAVVAVLGYKVVQKTTII